VVRAYCVPSVALLLSLGLLIGDGMLHSHVSPSLY
jgi:hypothetical protein